MTARTASRRRPLPRLPFEELEDARPSASLDEAGLDVRRGDRAAPWIRRRDRLVRRGLATADAVGLLTAFAVAGALFGWQTRPGRATPGWEELLMFLATVPGWLILAHLRGLHRHDRERVEHSTPDEWGEIFDLVTVGTWLFLAVACLAGPVTLSNRTLIAFWALAVVLVGAARAGARTLCRRGTACVQNAVIVGAGEIGDLIALKLRTHPEYGINLVGFVDAVSPKRHEDTGAVPVLGPPSHVLEIVSEFEVDRVILAPSTESEQQLLDLASGLREAGVRVDVVPRLFEIVGDGTHLHAVEGVPLLGLRPRRAPRASTAKRLIDVALATGALVALAPVLALIAVCIKLDSPGRVLFRSERIGTDGDRFFLLKFRTMRVSAEDELDLLMRDEALRAEFERTHKLRDDPRVTRTGRWLRRTSLDELPQLLNAVRGDLSLVGPRPITAKELDLMATQETAQNGAWSGVSGYWQIPGLRPGITGLWQINGRSTMSYEERVRLDKVYAANWSLSLDLLILAKTFRRLVVDSGAS